MINNWSRLVIPVLMLQFQPSEAVQKKAKESVHDPLEVKCGGSEHDIDGVSEETLVEITSQPMVCIAMSDDRLYSRSLSEECMFLRFRVCRVRRLKHIRNYNLRVSRLFLPPVASVATQDLDFSSISPACSMDLSVV